VGVAGVTAIARSTMSLTPSVAVAVTPLAGSVAVIVVVPTDAAVATPCVPAAFDTEATDGADELQVTAAVSACVVPSL
jgi:hypothetical protein